MGRKRDPKRDEAFKLYEESKGEILLKEIAEKLDVAEGTVRGWKNKDKWNDLIGTFQKRNTERSKKKVPKKDRSTIKKKSIESIEESEELNEREKLFCLHYVKNFNATQSALKAGYSPASAHVTGCRLLKNVKVSSYIKTIKDEMAQDLYVSARDVMDKWVKIAFADINDYVVYGKKEVQVMGAFGPLEDEHGDPIMQEVNYVDFNESEILDGSIISEVRKGKDGPVIKLHDKMKALEKLSQYFDLFPDDFKRKVEDEKLKMQREKLDHDINKNDDDDIFEISVKRAGGN